MFGLLFSFIASQMLLLALHLESSSFPKPLSKQEEKEAFLQMKNGDTKAGDRLVAHNLRLVAHIVKKYYAGAVEQDDLISIGTIGLIKAVRSFDIERASRFSTYAAKCIENEILMVFRASRKTQGTVSITDPIESNGDANGISIIDTISDPISIDESYEASEEKTQLKRLVDTMLTPTERQIVILRYGLTNQPPQTQQQIASMLNISRSYVSRIEKKALEKLKNSLNNATVK